jgi:hypothetical protein
MNRYLIAALPLAFLAAPVLAGPNCENLEVKTRMWEVARAFEEAGGVIRDMQVEDGCYEIKGEQGGVKLEIYFDPATGAELEREEI